MQKICHQKLSIGTKSHDLTHECSGGVATLGFKILMACRIIISSSQPCLSHTVAGEICQDFFIFGNVSGISRDQGKEGRDKFFKCPIFRKKSVYDHHILHYKHIHCQSAKICCILLKIVKTENLPWAWHYIWSQYCGHPSSSQSLVLLFSQLGAELNPQFSLNFIVNRYYSGELYFIQQ